MKYISTLLPVLVLSFVLLGCKKQSDDLFSTQVKNMAKENALMQGVFNDVLKVSENIFMNNGDARINTTGAPLGCITGVDSVVIGSLKRYTITFDPACTSYDGKVRGGVLVLELTGGNYNTVGAELIVKFDNYTHNSNLIQGKMVVLHETTDVFKVTVSDDAGSGYATMGISELDKTTKWKSTHKRTLVEGSSDMILINNKYKLEAYTGVIPFEGQTTDDKTYLANIESYLTLNYGCAANGKVRYPTFGVLNFELDIRKRVLNYGDETCDESVEMSWAGASTSFNLY